MLKKNKTILVLNIAYALIQNGLGLFLAGVNRNLRKHKNC